MNTNDPPTPAHIARSQLGAAAVLLDRALNDTKLSEHQVAQRLVAVQRSIGASIALLKFAHVLRNAEWAHDRVVGLLDERS